MSQETAEKVATSLTAESTKLLPHLPYLLQDFWELGSCPVSMVRLLQKHAQLPDDATVLDLACGKGAVAIEIARQLNSQVKQVKGVDLIPSFIACAQQKADEHNVSELCDFIVADINEVIDGAGGTAAYDLIIMGAQVDTLGTVAQALLRLKAATKPGGYILIDECYLAAGSNQDDILHDNIEYLTEAQWHEHFAAAGLQLVATVLADQMEPADSLDEDVALGLIETRAAELSERYPEESDLFESYVQSQRDEYSDLDSNVVGAIWLLQRMN